MQCLFGRRKWFILAVATAPLFLWCGLLVIVPTDWARRRLVDQLAEATGQHVSIGSVTLGVSGRLEIRDLALATTSAPDAPWLQASSAGLDVHLLQMLGGCCQPTDVEVVGVKARVKRNSDGTLEFADLLKPRPNTHDGSSSDSTSCRLVNLAIKDAELELIDDTVGSRFKVTRVQGQASWSSQMVSIDALNGRLNGGTFEFAARVDRSTEVPQFDLETRLRSVSLGGGLEGLSYLVPVIAGASDAVDGRMFLHLALKGQGLTRDTLKSTLEGNGTVVLDPVNLDGSQFLREVEVFGRLPRAERIGSVRSNFAIGEGKVATEDLTIKVAGLPLVLRGWTDFDGRLDYRAQPDLTDRGIPGLAKSLLAELDVKLDELESVHIEGTLAQVKVSIDRGAVARTDKSPSDRKKNRDARDRFTDRIVR